MTTVIWLQGLSGELIREGDEEEKYVMAKMSELNLQLTAKMALAALFVYGCSAFLLALNWLSLADIESVAAYYLVLALNIFTLRPKLQLKLSSKQPSGPLSMDPTSSTRSQEEGAANPNGDKSDGDLPMDNDRNSVGGGLTLAQIVCGTICLVLVIAYTFFVSN